LHEKEINGERKLGDIGSNVLAVKVSRQNWHSGKAGREEEKHWKGRRADCGVVTEQKKKFVQNRYCICADILCSPSQSCVQSESFAVGPSKTAKNLYRFIPS
jgi:hypothetical protein